MQVVFFSLCGSKFDLESSVEHHRVQDALVVLRLKVVADFVDFVVKIRGFREHRNEIADEEGSFDGFVVVVDDVNVDYMHGDVCGVFTVLKEFDHLVVDALFATGS